MSTDPKTNIIQITEPIVQQEDIFLVDVEIKHTEIPEIWILVDSEHGGVSLDICSKISRKVGVEIENLEVFNGAYTLNVSSPGLSRPLSDKRQYKKNAGRTAKVKYKTDGQYHQVTGVLGEVEETRFLIRQDENKDVRIAFSDVMETKIIPKI